MNIDIDAHIECRIVKGIIQKLTPNPWIKPFLNYIQKNPNLTPERMCQELFCDGGKARVSAVQNILDYFEWSGLLQRNCGSYTLTQAGKESCESGNLWQSFKGTFLFALLPLENSSLLLFEREVPDHWFDGQNDLEDLEIETENIIPYTRSLVIHSLESKFRSVYRESEIQADYNPKKGHVQFSGSIEDDAIENSAFDLSENDDSFFYDNFCEDCGEEDWS